MEQVIQYLVLKNQYYEKFFSISAKFLEKTHSDNWDGLTFFIDNRERILNIIRSFDFKIAKSVEEVDMEQCDIDHYKPRIEELFKERKALADKIVAIDLKLVSLIDEVKSETIRELKKSVQTAHQIDSFSPSMNQESKKTSKTA